MGPVIPGGFGQDMFGRTKGNVNLWQFGHNSQQIGQTVQEMGQTVLEIEKNKTQSFSLSNVIGKLSNIADFCTTFKQFSLYKSQSY